MQPELRQNRKSWTFIGDTINLLIYSLLHTYSYWLLYKFGMIEYCNRYAMQRDLKKENNSYISFLSKVTFNISMTSATQRVHL